MKYFQTFFRGQQKYILTFVSVSFFVGCVIVRRSFQFGWTLDTLQQSLQASKRHLFLYSFYFLIGTELLLFIVRMVSEFLKVKYRGYMNIHARVFGVDHAIQMDYQNIAKLGSGKLLQLIHSGMESYSFVFYEFGRVAIETVVFFLALLIMLGIQHRGFLLFFFVGFGLVVLFQRYAFRKLTQRRHNDIDLNERYTKQTAKILMNFILLKVFGIKEQEIKYLEKVGKNRVDNYVWIKFRFANIARAGNLLLILSFFLAIRYFGKQYVAGEVQFNIVLTIFFMMAFARRFMFQLGMVIGEFSEKLSYIHRYDEIVSKGQEQKDLIDHNKKSPDTLAGDIILDQITYQYDGAKLPLYEDLSLHIPYSQKVALIGRSGSGKSTLFKILTRMVSPQTGTVSFNIPKGQDYLLDQLSYTSIFQNIGLFRQDPLVFDGTVQENLTLHTHVGTKNLTDILQRVGLDHLGVDEVIGENGVLLSGGEKQRLALARIFLFDFDILLLDEPTSNLDEALERQILDDIFTTYQDKTIIVISHRPYIMDNVERVITMKKGEVTNEFVRSTCA